MLRQELNDGRQAKIAAAGPRTACRESGTPRPARGCAAAREPSGNQRAAGRVWRAPAPSPASTRGTAGSAAGTQWRAKKLAGGEGGEDVRMPTATKRPPRGRAQSPVWHHRNRTSSTAEAGRFEQVPIQGPSSTDGRRSSCRGSRSCASSSRGPQKPCPCLAGARQAMVFSSSTVRRCLSSASRRVVRFGFRPPAVQLAIPSKPLADGLCIALQVGTSPSAKTAAPRRAATCPRAAPRRPAMVMTPCAER